MRFSIIQLKQLSEDSEVSGNKLRNFKLLAFLEGAGIVYTGGKGEGGDPAGCALAAGNGMAFE